MIEDLALPLLQWYASARRELPWRANPDPYWVWLSEIMLQQTQIKAALPYFERFIEAYPDIEALAAADIDEVLTLWSGLGYYRRARNLHKAARAICRRHGGRFPRAYEDVLALPGIGRYTAGAICSIAFNQPHPVVDGNVRRVMARYLAVEEELKGKRLEEIWSRLQDCVEDQRVRPRVADFNQALMELGALICTPRSPDCRRCPLQGSCRGLEKGIAQDLPVKSKRRKVEEFHFLVAVARRDEEFLLHRDDSAPFLKGLWEFPRVDLPRDAHDLSVFSRHHKLRFKRLQSLAPVRHQITFRKLHFHPVTVSLQGPLPPGDYAWAGLNQPGYPVPAYVTKIESAARLLF
ncbi:MAG TPA: A/G-specific adenine glycosylase [Acidobacteriota bacterium]|nr:A/G-specific adenine glycosylase [Acidobacteriota bacterium]